MNSTSAEDHPFRNLFNWLKDRLWQISILLGGLGIAIIPSPFAQEGDWRRDLSWAVSIIALCLGTFGSWRAVPRLGRLKAQLLESENRAAELNRELQQEKADYIDAFQSNLAAFASHTLGFTDRDRISVFRHYDAPKGGVFVRIGRFSMNHEYNKPGRSVYPDVGGCLGLAWKDGTCFIPALSDPETDHRQWVQDMLRYGIPEQVSSTLTMKSRSYFGIAIADPKGTARIAVLLYESIDPNRFDPEALTHYSEFQGKTIAQFIESKKLEEPNPIEIAKEGW